MLIIGSHVGYKKDMGLLGSVKEALSYGANTFMFYTGAPQNTARSAIDSKMVLEALQLMKDKQMNFEQVIVHAPYIINLANGDQDKFQFSCHFLSQEIKRVNTFQMRYLVLHPGSHVGQGIDQGIANIINGLNQILDQDDTSVMILLETMAGKGSEIGSNFDELKKIIDGVHKKERVGVCFDTCHLHDAGYDLNHFDQILDEFEQKIGLEKLHCVHVNDSKNARGSHKDRHENIGFGAIGFETLLAILYHEKLKNIPKILETPYVDRLYAPYRYEIEMIQKMKFDDQLKEKIKQHS